MAHDDAALDTLRDEIAALYVGELEQFVSARTALVKRLRSEGRRDDAAAVGKLRKPTLAAWALDVVCVEDPGTLDALVAAGAGLRDAQEAALRGGAPADLRDAFDARRGVIRSITNAAVQRIVEHGGDGEAARDEISATLEAASLDDEVASALRSGRLERTVAAPSGFDLFAGMPVAPAAQGGRRNERGATAPSAGAESEAPPDRAAERKAHRARVRAALEAADQADALVAERRREVERLERELESAREALDQATRGAEEAQRVVDELTGEGDG